MSFNIRFATADDGENSWPYRREAVINFIGTSGYQVIGLQEVLFTQLHEIQQKLPHMHWVGVGREDGLTEGEYSAILYDSRQIEAVSSDTFWFSTTPEAVGSSSWGNANVRICTHGSFVYQGRMFEHYNLHIDHENAVSRINSIKLLLQRLQQRGHGAPTLITGDFNEGESGPCHELMRRAGFVDTYRAVNPDGPEQATFHGWSDTVDAEKIDYVFVSPGVRIIDATIVRETPYRRFLSDHFPVVATIEF